MAKSAGLEMFLMLRNSLMGLRLANRVPRDVVRTESKRAPRLVHCQYGGRGDCVMLTDVLQAARERV